MCSKAIVIGRCSNESLYLFSDQNPQGAILITFVTDAGKVLQKAVGFSGTGIDPCYLQGIVKPVDGQVAVPLEPVQAAAFYQFWFVSHEVVSCELVNNGFE